MKLNLGSGSDYRIGWTNVDRKYGDVKTDIKTMDWSAPVEAILLNHVVMYLRPEDLKPLLNKWYGWLIKGGTIHIETQDLSRVSDPETLYGTGENAGHVWGWTPETLGALMEEAGFEVLSIPGILHGKPERDFLICGIKL